MVNYLRDSDVTNAGINGQSGSDNVPELDVVIEIPRWSFIKRGSNGKLDFISPFPCPFNYGSVPAYVGGEGDLLDAVVLGPRLTSGSRVKVPARGAVGIHERGMYDDKLICSELPPTLKDIRKILIFFRFYAACKSILNQFRGFSGRCRATGWGDAQAAVARAERLTTASGSD